MLAGPLNWQVFGLQWWHYLLVLLVSISISTILTPVAMRFAFQHGIFDIPGKRKIHTAPVPYLGGLAIVIAFTAATSIAAVIAPPETGLTELLIVMGAALALAALGFIDDIRNLTPPVRLFTQVACTYAVWEIGVGVEFTNSGTLNFLLTFLWFVGITNAFNLLDNMDGLAAGLASISCGVIFFIAVANQQFLVASLAIGLSGCSLGFLRHNFFPARIYMGDGGAYFLGFTIAYLGSKLRISGGVAESLLPRVFACAIPVLDTTLVIVSRLSSRRNPLVGGKDHLSHRLVKIGLSVPITVSTIYCAAIFTGILAFLMTQTAGTTAWILAIFVGGILLTSLLLLLRIPVYTTERNSLS